MPAPPNGTCATATVIGAVPYGITVDTTAASTDHSISPTCTFGVANKAVWWVYTNPSTRYRLLTIDTLNTTYFNAISVWSGACGTLAERICESHTYDAPASTYTSWAIAPGETLHILVVDNDANAGGSLVLAIDAVELPTGTLIAGTRTTSSPKGEGRDAFSHSTGAVLSRDASTPGVSGVMASGVYRRSDDKILTFNGRIYEFYRSMGVASISADFTPPADWAAPGGAYQDQVGHIYVTWEDVTLSGHQALQQLDETTFAILHTWIDFAFPQRWVPHAVSADGTQFYFSTENVSSNANVIQVLDLGSSLVSNFATYATWNSGTLTGYTFPTTTGQSIPADGRLIMFAHHFTGSGVPDGIRCLMFSALGVLQNDFPITSAYSGSAIEGSALPADDLSVWVIDKAVYLDQYRLADGVQLSHFDITQTGTYGGLLRLPAPSAIVTVIAVSVNCANNTVIITGTHLDLYSTISVIGPDGSSLTFTVTSVAATQIVLTMDDPLTAGAYCVTVDNLTAVCGHGACGGTTFPLRRIRRFDPMFDRNLTTFVRRVEILIQSGMSANQPLYLRVSKDGGQTFGAFQAMAAGALSAFTTRLFLTNLGSGRNWVFEVMADSADPWFLIEATVDMELGTS